MKTEVLERPTQLLEQMVMGTSYTERDAALAEVRAGVEKILHPSSTRSYGGPFAHFLPLPQAPKVSITHAGWPNEPDEKEQAKFQAALQAVSLREMELTDLAQKANSKIPTLYEWAVELGKTEDKLLVSVLAESDRPAVENYVAEHQRFLRTCRTLADTLTF